MTRSNAIRQIATLPTCFAIFGLVCALVAEELLGYPTVTSGASIPPLNGYLLLCGTQLLYALAFAFAANRIGSLARRPRLLVIFTLSAILGSALALLGSYGAPAPAGVAGFCLLALGALALKIFCLDVLTDVSPSLIAPIIFIAVLIHSFLAPLYLLAQQAMWMLAGMAITLGMILMAGAHTMLESPHRDASEAASLRFVRPFKPSAPVFMGVGILWVSINFLNPVMLYETISPEGFVAHILLIHLLAALTFGVITFAETDSSYSLAFKVVGSFVLIGFLLMALLGTSAWLPRMICTAAFSLTEYVTFLAIVDLATYCSTNRLKLFSLYYVFMRSCAVAGVSLGQGDVIVMSFGSALSLFGSILAVLCVIAYGWLLTERHLNEFFWGNTAEHIKFAERSTNPADNQLPCASADEDSSSEKDAEPLPQSSDIEANVGRRIEALAARSGMTPRETEVFGLMAQGRSATFIAEELFVSANTVRRHISHIYDKLGVHSKQELITLVQQENTP